MKLIFEIPDTEFDRAVALQRWVIARRHLSTGEAISVFDPVNVSDCGFRCRVLDITVQLDSKGIG